MKFTRYTMCLLPVSGFTSPEMIIMLTLNTSQPVRKNILVHRARFLQQPAPSPMQVRSGMGACARAARHCIQFPPVLQGPPSGHPPPGPSPSPCDADQPAATTRHVVGPLACTT